MTPLRLAPVNPRSNVEGPRAFTGGGKRESGYEFYKSWISPNLPRMIIVTFQHPTPYFDDSYAVNSANNGPYGDAIMRELVPYVESHFRIIKKPYARVLSGGSTGGWESLALQLYHPEFFGGTWTFFPDPIDFRRYQLIDVVRRLQRVRRPERGAGRAGAHDAAVAGRAARGDDAVDRADGVRVGDARRSAAQLDIWNAMYGRSATTAIPGSSSTSGPARSTRRWRRTCATTDTTCGTTRSRTGRGSAPSSSGSSTS